MLRIIITGFCLAAVSTPITAQQQQNALGFQPTNNLTVAKVNGAGWGAPPPPPGGWPAPPPPPPPPPPPGTGWAASPPAGGWSTPTESPTTGECLSNAPPVGTCPSYDPLDPPDQPTYLPTEDCSCFAECTTFSGGYETFQCPGGLYFNPTLNVCDYPVNVACEQRTAVFGGNIVPKQV